MRCTSSEDLPMIMAMCLKLLALDAPFSLSTVGVDASYAVSVVSNVDEYR